MSAFLMSALLPVSSPQMAGKWLWVSYADGNRITKPYQPVVFTRDGKILFNGIKIAGWTYRKGQITLHSEAEPSFNGKFRVKWRGGGHLLVEKNGIRLEFRRWTDDFLLRTLAGVWLYYGDPEVYLKIGDSSMLTEFVLTDYGTGMSVATGIYLPEEKQIVIRNPGGYFTGTYKVEQENEREMTLERNGKTYDLIQDMETAPPPPLYFSREDFSAGGNEARLPWKQISWLDYDTSLIYHYQRLTYIEGLERYRIANEFDRHQRNRNNETFCIARYLFKISGKRMRISENCKGNVMQSHNPFFPMPRPDRFRIVSTDSLYETEDFSLHCTVVEGIHGNKKFRYWMINDRPGVYARIVVQYPGDRDGETYYIRELDYWEPAKSLQSQ